MEGAGQASDQGQRGKWRLLRRGALGVVIFTVVLFVAAWLLVRSSFVSSEIERRLAERTGLVWQVEGARWNGWRTVSLVGIAVKQPEGIAEQRDALSIDAIEVSLEFNGLRPSPELIRIIRPEGVLAVEMLAGLARSFQSVSEPPDPPDEAEPAAPTAEAPPEVSDDVAAADSAPAAPPAQDEAGPQTKAKPVQGVKAWCEIEDASLTVISDRAGATLAVLEGVEGRLPLRGFSKEGFISWEDGRITAGEQILWQPVEKRIQLKIEGKTLSCTTRLTNEEGLHVDVAASLRLDRGLLTRASLLVPAQTFPRAEVLGGRALIGVDQLSMRVELAGALSVPRTLQIGCAWAAVGIRGEDRARGQTVHFFDSSGDILLNAGGLFVRDVRAVGDELSILGNALVLRSGDLGARVRVIADHQAAGYLLYHLLGVTEVRGGNTEWFGPSPTPERVMRDIEISGTSESSWIDAGPNHRPLPLKVFLRNLKSFISAEVSEERRLRNIPPANGRR